MCQADNIVALASSNICFLRVKIAILALGSTADHGLLRLFHWYKAKIHRRRDCAESPRLWRSKFSANEPWAKNYAAERKNIKWWRENSDWWELYIEKDARRWRILPISHPSRNMGDYTTILRKIQSL